MKLLTPVQLLLARISRRVVVAAVAPAVVLVVVVLGAVVSGMTVVAAGVIPLPSRVRRSWSRSWCTSTAFRRP
jgi:TRAP-type mannitol/chloroaromatic compound transport system permease large subunit